MQPLFNAVNAIWNDPADQQPLDPGQSLFQWLKLITGWEKTVHTSCIDTCMLNLR